MLNFYYQANDPLGKLRSGVVRAVDERDARSQLEQDGLSVLSVEEDEASSLFPKRIKKSEIIYTTSQLAIMVDTGISLADALDGLAEQEPNPSLRELLYDLKARVEAGEDFSTALRRHPKQFNESYIALIKASEHTGSLGSMLERIAGYLHKELDTRGKIRAAMIYPVVMLVLAIGVTIFLLTYVLPKFLPLFERRGMDLPLPTKVMMTASTALIDYWFFWGFAAVALVGGYLFARSNDQGRLWIDWAKINMPIIGPVVRKITISRSVRTLGTLLQSGVPMIEAIELSSAVSANGHYQKLWQHVIGEITQGRRIHDALEGCQLFPKTLIQMIGSGEETGKLDYVLGKVSAYYDKEVDTSIKTATSLIEPLLITAMGVIVGGIGLALMLPIFQLSRSPM